MTITAVTLASSIAALNVSGIQKIYDLDEMPNELTNRDVPAILPAPDYISNFRLTRKSQGSGSVAYWDLSYNITYRLFQAPAGAFRSIGEVYQDLVSNTVAFVDSVIANSELAGALDSTLRDVRNIGIVTDPAETEYFGAEIVLEILQHIN